MGLSTTPVNTNPQSIQGAQGDVANLISGLVRDPSTLGVSDLQRAGSNSLINFLGQPAPEMQTFQNLEGGLLDIFGMNSAQAVGEAAFPLFQRGLQEGLGQLSSSAPGRFSTAFDQQGIGLAERSLQDFNLLQQQAFQQNMQNRLGAANLLGSLAGQAGSAPFGRAAQATQLGIGATSSNPALQALLGGMGFLRPSPNDTIVGQGVGGALGGAAKGALGGAAAGSVIPGIGTLTGGILGGIAGLF